MIKAHGYPMVMNCTIHRQNIDHIDAIIQMAVDIGAEYVELANTQYYGWAQINRDQLLPVARTDRTRRARHQRVARRSWATRCAVLRGARLLRSGRRSA
jgi:MoaA/NifB/PqqE/SkfB family radical SAM enzyme